VTAPPTDPRITLSVVIVTRNEEDRIRDCIESVLTACRTAVSAFEILLVDSASTDRTVDYATEYDITVLRIPDEHTVAASAGRYAGEQAARGEMVLHVDGDMVLTETWLTQAVAYMEETGVAGVEGCLDSVTQSDVELVDSIGGVVLYDADALSAVGGFDPHMLGNEDVDLGFRLTAAGYDLVRLPVVSASHPSNGTLSEPIRRWRAGYYFAPGQAIRKSVSSPRILGKFLFRQKYKILLFVWLCVGVASLVASPLLALWALLSVVGLSAIVAKRGLRGAVQFGMVKLLGIPGIAVGLCYPPRPAEAFPLDEVEVVKNATDCEAGSLLESQAP
jgi:glycosyltransferase involved in cell wall biosynthesis